VPLRRYCPAQVSYRRLVELMPRALVPGCGSLYPRKGRCTGISVVDATPIAVCPNKRSTRNQGFDGSATRGKSSMGWDFGFKLHLMINDEGALIIIETSSSASLRVCSQWQKGSSRGGSPMRFYTQPHQGYCGIDLHARTMYVCILSWDGEIVLHRNMKTTREAFLKAIAPYRDDPVVAVECMFTWYGLADLCVEEDITFVLGHAQYMKAIHGGKAKNDRLDAQKIAVLLRGGMLPQAYTYPAKMRATRDLLRRRLTLVRQRAERLTHIRQTNAQYNLPALGKDLKSKPPTRGDDRAL
jgi:Transposase DDE domain/Transposase